MENLLSIGDPAPDFKINNQDGKEFCLGSISNKWLIVYFYPKDNTSGCTKEAKEFTELMPQFESFGAKIIGISPDSEKSHIKFINKHDLTIELLSDQNHEVAKKYDVWKLKKFMGREYMGIVRSTFLINLSKSISFIWFNVKVKNHGEIVLEKLQELSVK